MGRIVKDARLDSRESRLKLKEREDREPYWRLIHQGLHLGYRKSTNGGVWLVRVRDGERYTKKVIGRADDFQDSDGQDVLSFREAQSAAMRFTAPQHTAKNLTVTQAAERYMDWFKEHRKGHRNTRLALDAHIIPAFGSKLVTDLKTRDIREWHEKLAATPPRKRPAKGKKQAFYDAPKTVDGKRARKSSANRYLTVLKAILNKTYHDELVSDNSAWKRVKPFENTDEPVIRFLTEDECQRLINTCPPDFRAMVKAGLFTGARYGELTGLKAEDVSIDTGKIFIRPSKSGKGRHIPLSAEVLDFFKTLVTGKTRGMNVFVRDDGKAWAKDYQHRPLKEACTQARISPAIGFHELRHTYASLLAQRGADLLTISKLLGHADTRITSRHYAHLCDKTLANAVEALLPAFGHTGKEARTVIAMRSKKAKRD